MNVLLVTPKSGENIVEVNQAEESEKAFLVEGIKVIRLLSPIVNIGRRIENDIVINDPRVSRYHAQLRMIGRRFVVFDLGSTSGTFVNGQRVQQCVIYPDDVISLAGAHLVLRVSNNIPRPDLRETDRF